MRDPIVIGGITREAVDAGLAPHRGAFDACWSASPEPRPRGRVALRFAIDAFGATSSARVHATSLRAPAVEACLVQAVSAAQFSALASGRTAIVTYPLSFGL